MQDMVALEACEPLAGSVVSQAVQRIVGDAPPVCFRVAQVTLRFKRKTRDFRRNAR